MSDRRDKHYEFERREIKGHYFLWYHDYNSYYYVFKRRDGKELKIEVSLEQYYETADNWYDSAYIGKKPIYLIEQIKNKVESFKNRHAKTDTRKAD